MKVPSSRVRTRPQAAWSYRPCLSKGPTSGGAASASKGGQEVVHRVDTGARRAQVRAVPDVVDDPQGSVRQGPLQVLADRDRRDQVLAALHDEGRRDELRNVCAVVGQERGAREVLRDVRVGAAEAVGQLD